jgi:predicted RNA-binding Zn ribbon-like protein
MPLLAVVWSAAALLTSPSARGVAACPGNGCGWIFADPRGRRRWCSMAWCGNRNKARRHAQRRRGLP